MVSIVNNKMGDLMNILSIIKNKEISVKIEKILVVKKNINYLGNYSSFSGIYLEPEIIDIIFIEVDDNNIGLIKLIKEKFIDIEIVFISNDSKFVYDGYEINILDYISFNFDEDRIEKTLKRNRKYINEDIIVQFFNSFSIRYSENILKFRTQKAKELCAYLFLKKGKYIKKEIIAEQLWPYMLSDKAYKQLYNNIYYLRKMFKNKDIPLEIKSNQDAYILSEKGKIKNDLDEFYNLLELKENGIDKAIKIFGRGFLFEEEYIWSKEIQEGIKNEFLVSLDDAIKKSIDKNNIDRALFLCEKSIKEDIYNEDRYLKLLKIIKDNRSKKEYLIKLKEIEVFFQNELKIKFNPTFLECHSEEHYFAT